MVIVKNNVENIKFVDDSAIKKKKIVFIAMIQTSNWVYF